MHFGNGDAPGSVSRVQEKGGWIHGRCRLEPARRLIGIAIMIASAGCGMSTRENSPSPDGAAVAAQVSVERQIRRTFEFEASGLRVSNEFAAARLGDFRRIDDTLYEALIRPENAPVNNSAWYGFKMWAPATLSVWVRLSYQSGSHRYVPKLSRDLARWDVVTPEAIRADTTTGTALVRLDVSRDTLWVSAQERTTSEQFYSWMNAAASHRDVRPSMIGKSVEGRPIVMLDITSNRDADRFVLIIARQHPPEVSASLALAAMLNRIVEGDSLATEFRSKNRVLVVPLVNPDGVDGGYWWYNAKGVDLNRDWLAFEQPETGAVRDAFAGAISSVPGGRALLAIDLHSAPRDHISSLGGSGGTLPDNFTDSWLAGIRVAVPGYEIDSVPPETDLSNALNFFDGQFGSTAVSLNFGDERNRRQLAEFARACATELMRMMLEVEIQ